MKCRYCDGSCRFEAQIRDRRFFRCLRCGALLADLSEAEYEAIPVGYDPCHLISYDDADLRAALGVEDSRRFLQRVLNKRVAPTRYLLDVGCGTGRYLIAGRELGLDVLGVEPDPGQAQVAVERLGLPVLRNYFDIRLLGGKQFDIVLLSHVIEHILYPVTFVEALFAAVAPGGMLVVVTPNAESLVARTLGDRWPMLAPIDHVSMAGRGSLGSLHPMGTRTSFSWQSEYMSEYLSTVVASIRNPPGARAVNVSTARAAPVPRGQATRSHLWHRQSVAMSAARLVLGVASYPFHLAARIRDRQGALAHINVRG